MSLRLLSPILWIAIFLCVLELGLEFRAHDRGWSTLLFGGEMSGETETASASFGPTDGFPFRSRPVPIERDPGVARLWIGSSSYAEDRRLPAPRVFPNRLETLLREAGHPVQVLNASRNGLATTRNVEILRELGPTWRPDVCVLYQMTNDVDWITNALLAPGADPEADLGPTRDESENEASAPSVITTLSEETTIYSLLKSNVTSRLSAGRLLVDELPARADEVFAEWVRAFVAESRAIGARPVLCTFATRNTARTRDSVPRDVVLALRRVNLYLSMDGWIDAVERFNAVLRRVADEQGVLLVDVAAAVANRADEFRDFSHLHVAGHERIARALFDALSDLPELGGEGGR